MTRSGWCLLSVTLALGCGGATREVIEEPGPPHQGHGLYELTIERVSDDCQPKLVEGRIGPVVVVVEGNGANIPLYEAPDTSLDPARTDIRLHEPFAYAVPLPPQPDCSFTNLHVEVVVTTANAERIDVSYERGLSGTANCPAQHGGMRDCTSRRIFHFAWLHACQNSDDITDCLEE